MIPDSTPLMRSSESNLHTCNLLASSLPRLFPTESYHIIDMFKRCHELFQKLDSLESDEPRYPHPLTAVIKYWGFDDSSWPEEPPANLYEDAKTVCSTVRA